MRLLSAWLFAAAGLIPMAVSAAEVIAGPPSNLSVTIYRAPSRAAGALDLDSLRGFALVSETRTVQLPAGDSRVRFEGVVDGIESASALLTGLPAQILEKDRDAQLLSPSALVSASVGKQLELVRTDPKSGQISRIPGTIRSDAGEGVVFESAEGIEALRCSAMPETFSFSPASDLSATPTLSVVVRSAQSQSTTVTLSYLARWFDWSASYIATLSPDRTRMDIAAWVTLANGNGVSLPAARAQVVAGRLNRESGAVEPYEWPRPILAQCWPQGSTSDPVQQPRIESATPLTLQMRSARAEIMQDVPIAMAAMAAPQVVEEQLGDLKLYRVPDVTSVLSRQMKQVRLLDRRAVPVQFYYSAEVSAAHQSVPFAARMKLRTKNDSVHHLGLPLPSGSVDTFIGPHGTPLLLSESPLHDTALDEEVEIGLGDSPDVQVSSLPGAIEIDNARPVSIAIELRLALADGVELAHADQPVTRDRGAQLFKLTVPANGRAAIHYETTRTR